MIRRFADPAMSFGPHSNAGRSRSRRPATISLDRARGRGRRFRDWLRSRRRSQWRRSGRWVCTGTDAGGPGWIRLRGSRWQRGGHGGRARIASRVWDRLARVMDVRGDYFAIHPEVDHLTVDRVGMVVSAVCDSSCRGDPGLKSHPRHQTEIFDDRAEERPGPTPCRLLEG